MGFNKIFLGEKTLLHLYENGGVSSVLKYLSKYDAVISTDEFAGKLIDFTTLPKEELIQKIDELFTSKNK